jgi:carbonic anhydrase
MSATDELLENARHYAARVERDRRPGAPAKKVAVVACMDARILPSELLGLEVGDAHVIRNAGAVVTDDVLRSLAISQRLLGTEEVVLIAHTDCGMQAVDDERFERSIEEETGVAPDWETGSFSDLEGHVRRSVAAITTCPFLPRRHAVRGFVYDVRSRELREVR